VATCFAEKSNRDINLFKTLKIIELDHTHADKFCQDINDINEIKKYRKCAFFKNNPMECGRVFA